MVAEVPYVMVASPKAPISSFSELIAYAKAHPGKLNFGVPNGAPPHMLAAWFKSLTNIDVVLITYRGGANVLGDLLGGQIDLAVETSSILLPQLSDGKLRPLGTPSSKRLADLPDVPTMAELGVPNFIASSWTGIVAPAGTPKAIVEPSCNHSKRKPCSARRRITPTSSPANCRNGSRWQSCRVRQPTKNGH